MAAPQREDANTTGPTSSVDSRTANEEDDERPALAEKRRVHYIEDEDLPDYHPNDEFGQPLHRTRSAGSTYSIHSLRSVHGRTRAVDPAIALPIQYRTVSFNVSNSQERTFADTKDKRDKATQDFADIDWHKLSIHDVYAKFSSSPTQGLLATEVISKAAEYGPNEPSRPPSRLWLKIFWYLFGGFGTLLFVGSILVFVSWKPLGRPPAQANLALAIVLAVVFALQASFNAWQDFSSSRVMKSITGILPDNCLILRDGRRQSIPAREVVPGDILCFSAGDKLPADIRFVEISSDTKFDRSILTGESMPLSAVLDSTDDNYLETRCIGLQGTHCTQGSGFGIVVATGDRTVFGRIARLTNAPSIGKTTLQKEIFNLVIIIVSLMFIMNIVAVSVWAGYVRIQYPDYITTPILIVDLVSVGIAFVPEGLPIAVTASLTITANVMKRNKILCKSLKTVETLGAVSVLLSDKTGTLTKNQMVATDCLIGFSTLSTAETQERFSQGDSSGLRESINQLRAIASLCNVGEFDVTQMHMDPKDRTIIGDATDQAILRFAEGLSPVKEIRDLWRIRFDLAFNSKNKFAIRILSTNGDGKNALETALSPSKYKSFDDARDLLLTIKGAPDVLLGRCDSYVGEDGECHDLNDGMRTTIEEVKDRLSSQGKRVILLARKVLPSGTVQGDPSDGDFDQEASRHAQNGLTFAGLIGIVDPPRDEVPDTVKTLRRAGIRVMMVTGDFKLTAIAIAQACGIVTTEIAEVHSIHDLPKFLPMECTGKHPQPLPEPTSRSIVVSGPELITLNETQWLHLLAYQEVVFARTTPEQKLRIVKAYKARSNIVAMTGDGVNDAPSLKEADIGIAPGSGSDIAIEAADMVLLESFSAITQAVLYGRVVFDNLKKTVAYLLPAGSFSEFWPVMTSIVFGLPQILSSFLMIIICCFTDCAAATTLAYEKPEADVMLRKPRNPKKDRLVDWRLLLQVYGFVGIIETVCSFAMSFWYAQRRGLTFSSLWFSFGTTTPPHGLTADEMQDILNKASSIYFVNLVVMQWFNLMALRTRRLSIFSHPPLFNKKTQNWFLFPAIGFALAVVFVFCYIPSLQKVIDSASVPVEYWFLPMAYGMGLLVLDEARKAVARRRPNGWVAKVAW